MIRKILILMILFWSYSHAAEISPLSKDYLYKNIGSVLSLQDVKKYVSIPDDYTVSYSGFTTKLPYTINKANSRKTGGVHILSVKAEKGTTVIQKDITLVITTSAWKVDNLGWTIFFPSADTRKIFVSSSSGNDSNDGLSPTKAVKTILQGYTLLRFDRPDWLILKKGDVWENESVDLNRSGRSLQEPQIIRSMSDYGTGALPLLRHVKFNKMNSQSGPINHFVFEGLNFKGPESGMTLRGPHTNILVENCIFYNGNPGAGGVNPPVKNYAVRRSVITDNFTIAGAKTQGLQLRAMEDILLEENVFDHNGWNDEAGITHEDIRHNIYIQFNNTGDIIIRRNIISNASSIGLLNRSGGIVEDNIFIRNPIGLVYGGGDGELEVKQGGVSGSIAGNVFVEGINGDKNLGWGMEVRNTSALSPTMIENNIISSLLTTVSNQAKGISLSGNSYELLQNVHVRKNVVYNWPRSLQFWVRPGEELFNVIIQDNEFQYERPYLLAPAGYQPGILTRFYNGFGSDLDQVSFIANHYHSTIPITEWFEGPVFHELDYSYWKETMETGGATNYKLSYKNPNVSIGGYMGTVGQYQSTERYIEKVRLQSKINWHFQYTAIPMLRYFRNGFTRK